MRACSYILFAYRKEIVRDQKLRAIAAGDTKSDNPQLFVRQRFQKLYNDFRPEFFYWRLVNIARKLSLVLCSTFFSRDPMLQASVAVCIMFFCYVIQASKRPFLSRMPASTGRISEMAAEVGAARAAKLSYVFDYNTLENALLITSTMTLMGGMVFSSASLAVSDNTSFGFIAVSIAIFTMIVSAVAGFVLMLLREIYRSFQFALITSSIEDKRARTITVTQNKGYRGVRLVDFAPSTLVPAPVSARSMLSFAADPLSAITRAREASMAAREHPPAAGVGPIASPASVMALEASMSTTPAFNPLYRGSGVPEDASRARAAPGPGRRRSFVEAARAFGARMMSSKALTRDPAASALFAAPRPDAKAYGADGGGAAARLARPVGVAAVTGSSNGAFELQGSNPIFRGHPAGRR